MYTMTTIRVTNETSRKIIDLKQKYEFKNANEVIDYLIKTEEKYQNSVIVRLVKE